MLVILLARISDVIFYYALNKELLQNSTDGIEPTHICSEVKPSEPGPSSDLRDKEILYHTDYTKTNDKNGTYDNAEDKVLLKSFLAGFKAFVMDLKLGEYRKYDGQNDQVKLHDPRKDVGIVLYKRSTYNMREDLNGDDLAGHCYQ